MKSSLGKKKTILTRLLCRLAFSGTTSRLLLLLLVMVFSGSTRPPGATLPINRKSQARAEHLVWRFALISSFPTQHQHHGRHPADVRVSCRGRSTCVVAVGTAIWSARVAPEALQ